MKKLSSKGFSVIEVLLVLIVVGLIGFIGWIVYDQSQKEDPKPAATITNFEECKAAGNPIAESFPEQCTANGKTFVNTAQKPQEYDAEKTKYIKNFDAATDSLKAALVDTFFVEAKATCTSIDKEATTYITVKKVVRNDFALVAYCGSGADKILASVDGTWKRVAAIGMGHPGCADVDTYEISKEIAGQCILKDGSLKEVNYR